MARRILCIGGTRPEAIKLAPLLLEAAFRPRLTLELLATGQQPMLFDEALAEFGLAPDHRLPPIPPHPDPDVATGRFATALLPLLRSLHPDLVLVQGDTSSAYAGALAATELAIPVAHVEAGLRSGDLANPWPEERNRVAIDRLAALLLAPTDTALDHLRADPAVLGLATVTGNTGIDALLWMRDRIGARLHEPGRPLLLLTCHRRESFGTGIAAICTAALRLAARGDLHILCPVHSNPAVADTIRAMLSGHPAITLARPLSYRETVRAMASARLILSDSGGMQEEAPALGTPTLVLRDVTERPEGIATGNLRLVGTDPDRIVAEAAHLLDDPAAHAAMARPAFPFGAGGAAKQILDAVQDYVPNAPSGDTALHSGGTWRRDAAPRGA